MNKRGIGVRNRLSGIILAGGIVAAGFGLAGFGAGNTSALDLSISTPSDPILEVSLSSNLVQLDLTPSLGVADFKTANLTVTAGTNNITGYTVYMNIDNPNLTRTEAFNNTTPVIASLAENADGYTEASFTANSWGYRLGAGNYLAIPTSNTTLNSKFEPTNGESTTITFASKVDMDQPAGAYNTDVDIVAVANPSLILQDINTWGGSVLSGQVVKAKDNRDNKNYTISRLADGRLWFLDNLALNLLDANVQNNLSASTTNASAVSISALLNGGRANGNQYATAGVTNWISGYSNSVPQTSMIDKDTIPGNAPTNGQGDNKVGGYYNYCATTAGSYCYGDGTSAGTTSGNATEDICPKGWRLPTSDPTGEYQVLYTAYGSNYNSFRTALSLPLSGYFYSGSANSKGVKGYFWSSSRVDNDYMYYLFANSDTSIIDPPHTTVRYYGYTIRCIAKKPDIIVAFNANGGTGTMSAQNLGEVGGTLTANAFTKADFMFAGWNTAADGSGASYANSDIYNGPSTTLYAQWRELPPSGTFERTFYDAGKSTITINGNEYYKMQDMTASICSNIGDTEAAELADTRDNNIYSIAKLGSYCWMTKNLRLARGTAVTPDDTNTDANWTVPQTDFDNGGWNSPRTKVSSDGEYWYNLCATAVGKSCGDIGGWTPTYDICPKGWRLPINAEYNTLTDYVSQFLPVAGGYYYGSGEGSSTLKSPEVGRWWSKQAWGSMHWYVLQYNSSNNALGVYGSDYYNKQNSGYYVRCIAK